MGYSQAIRSTRKALKLVIKEINQTAADLAKKEDYERAEAAPISMTAVSPPSLMLLTRDAE